MKATIKVIDLDQGLSSYSINAEDMTGYVLVKSSFSYVLTKNTSIVWGSNGGNAPIDTVVKILRVNGSALGVYTFSVFGVALTKNIASWCDMIYCIKIGSGANDWKQIYIASFDMPEGGGIEKGPQGVLGSSDYSTTNLRVKAADLVDNDTIVIQPNGKLKANIAGDTKVSSIDDFIDDTNKVMSAGAVLVDSIGGVVSITSNSGNSHEANVSDQLASIKIESKPEVSFYLNIATRGNSDIRIGIVNDLTSLTAGAYFKFSGTSMECFMVVNDGTEHAVTTGVTFALLANKKLSVSVSATGEASFFVDNIHVGTQTGYSVPDVAYKQAVGISNGSVDSNVKVDYFKISLMRK